MYGQGVELASMNNPLTEDGASLPSPKGYKKSVQSLTRHMDPTRYDEEDYDPESDDHYLKEIPAWTFREKVVAVVAGGSVISASLALIIASMNPVVLLTGVLGIIIPPYSALQEQKITDCKAMRETNMVMEIEMNNLKYNNERLSEENGKLQASVERLVDVKEAYVQCQKMENVSIQALETQLRESQHTLQLMKNNHIDEVVQNIIDVMLAVDVNQDVTLSDEEIDIMTKRVEKINHVEINDEAFKRKIIEYGRDIFAVATLLQELMDDDPNTAPEEDGVKIFQFLDHQ